MDVILINRNEVDWNNYLLAAKAALGRSITKKLDEKNLDARDNKAFLITLSELKNGGDPGILTEHCFYSFLSVATNSIVLELFENTNLTITVSPCQYGLNLYLMSGDLSQWREAIINTCTTNVSFECRGLFNKILYIFEFEEKLHFLTEYSKEKHKDTTIILRPK